MTRKSTSNRKTSTSRADRLSSAEVGGVSLDLNEVFAVWRAVSQELLRQPVPASAESVPGTRPATGARAAEQATANVLVNRLAVACCRALDGDPWLAQSLSSAEPGALPGPLAHLRLAPGLRELLPRQLLDRIDGACSRVAAGAVSLRGVDRAAWLAAAYEELSSSARWERGLYQTPPVAVELILDLTLGAAISGLEGRTPTLVDPACGPGAFLVPAFSRLLATSGATSRAALRPEDALDVLDSRIAGYDLDPLGCGLAALRLVLAAGELAGAPHPEAAAALEGSIVCQDSLLAFGGPSPAGTDEGARRFDVVVANPPYGAPEELETRDRYGTLFRSARGHYTLTAPFIELLFRIASPHGWVGVLASSNFATRSFGRALVKEVLAGVEVRLVADLRGTPFPGRGFGTPTLLLVARNRAPRDLPVRWCSTAERAGDAEDQRGSLSSHWSSLRSAANGAGNTPSVALEERPADSTAKHPWVFPSRRAGALGDGEEQTRGASPTWERSGAWHLLGDLTPFVGQGFKTGANDVYVMEQHLPHLLAIERGLVRPVLAGSDLRDWVAAPGKVALVPYVRGSARPVQLEEHPGAARYLLRWREILEARRESRMPLVRQGRPWWEFARKTADLLLASRFIAFPDASAGVHFCLAADPFLNSAYGARVDHLDEPTIQLALATLNSSSTAADLVSRCPTLSGRVTDPEAPRAFRCSGNSVRDCRIPRWGAPGLRGEVVDLLSGLGGEAVRVAGEMAAILPHLASRLRRRFLARRARSLGKEESQVERHTSPTAVGELAREMVAEAAADWRRARDRLVYLQEEIDWACYFLFGVVDERLARHQVRSQDPALGALAPGTRPFERPSPGSGADGSGSVGLGAGRLHALRREALGAGGKLSALECPTTKRSWSGGGVGAGVTRIGVAWMTELIEGAYEQGEGWLTTEEIVGRLGLQPAAWAAASVLTRGAGAGALLTSVQEVLQLEAVPTAPEQIFRSSGLGKLEGHGGAGDRGSARRHGTGVRPVFRAADYRRRAYWRLRGPYNFPFERFQCGSRGWTRALPR